MNYLAQIQEKLQSSVLSVEESKSLKGKGCRGRQREGCGGGRRGRRGGRRGGGCSGGGTTTTPENPTVDTNETKGGTLPELGGDSI